MIIQDLSEVLLDHADLVFVDCETGDVATLAMRATEQGCTGFEFGLGGNGFVPIFCANKVAWIRDAKEKTIVFVSDHWKTVERVQAECKNVTVYYLMEPPDSHLLLCPILVMIVCLTLFFS
jgi:hypothetical protein